MVEWNPLVCSEVQAACLPGLANPSPPRVREREDEGGPVWWNDINGPVLRSKLPAWPSQPILAPGPLPPSSGRRTLDAIKGLQIESRCVRGASLPRSFHGCN